jgi:hypothetical protein
LAEKVAQTTPPVSPTKTPVIETPVDEDDDAIDDEMDEDDDIYEDFEDEDFEEIDEDKSPAPIIATKPAAPLSPFARPLPPAAKPVIVSDDEDEEFDDDDDEEFDDKDTDDEPIKPTLPVTPTAFKRPAASLSPFSKPTPKPVISDDDVEDDSEDDDEDETIAPAKPILPAKPTPFKSPAASFSPFSRPAAKPVGDDEDEDDEESLMRRGRAGDSDAVSDLFKDFMGDSDDEPETLAPFKPTTSKPSSLFGNLQKPVNPSSGKLSSPSKPSTGMFKSSPQKPSEDDEEDDLDDLRYVDDEEYTDYDDE